MNESFKYFIRLTQNLRLWRAPRLIKWVYIFWKNQSNIEISQLFSERRKNIVIFNVGNVYNNLK